MNSAQLAEALLEAVRAQQFELTNDKLQDGRPLGLMPSIDLAVAAFPAEGTPVWANVLFSREHPQGLVASFDGSAGPVNNVHYLADQQDAEQRSPAWLPGADWSRLDWQTLAGQPGQPRVVAPYPASLIKLMVMVAVAHQVDLGRCRWEQDWRWQQRGRRVLDWAFDMTVVSCNDATSALVALLHELGALGGEHNEVEQLFQRFGLGTLRFADTRADGGWRNADGAGVGHLQMTAWDALRLLWLIDPDAPPAPWLPAGQTPMLSAKQTAAVLYCLREQGLHEMLSSTVLAGVPGWVPGLPARVPARWLQSDGSARLAEDRAYPADLRQAQANASLEFLHKTGNTENYGSDAGIARGLGRARRHYLIALTSSLGRRFSPGEPCATTWRLAALGARIDAQLRTWFGD
ncbi:serine hydrolase [Pelomonas sp. SE-A7]|uniref:serine hydrolase n=1 Tax=Pelomonas sp. SE-A7 TaxID=3054953 RepID=UPI00259CAA76|nr:serine hydrolase [Pelomonas sp. SE-A7]MDM4768140.1 hypothetical protein [Pelomonas sp. SE-A7]